MDAMCWRPAPGVESGALLENRPIQFPDDSLKILTESQSRLVENRRAVPPGSLQVEDKTGDCRSMANFIVPW